MFFSCFGLNSCNIFAISSSVLMHRVVTMAELNVYRQHLSSIYKNINHFSTISSRCKGNKIIVNVFHIRLRFRQTQFIYLNWRAFRVKILSRLSKFVLQLMDFFKLLFNIRCLKIEDEVECIDRLCCLYTVKKLLKSDWYFYRYLINVDGRHLNRLL